MRRLLLSLVLVLFATAASTQDTASLVADQVLVDPGGQVTATGNVVVFFQGTQLTAEAVRYDRNGEILTISGPITVIEPTGAVLLANQAELSQDLQNGILRSARLILDEQLQLAANEIARVGDRYTRLDRVVASSCEVCANNPVPLWEVRAARVIHDELERQLFFESAQFRVAGVPVFYLPRFRLPDPSLRRATGFLFPQFPTSSNLGTGLKVPYFIALGDHADVTLTPYISDNTRTLEFRQRFEHRRGWVNSIGAISNDDIEDNRGYLFTNARYQLPRGYIADLRLELASDPGYLYTYNYAEKDRLSSEVKVSRVREKDLFRASVTDFRTFRDDEIAIEDQLPNTFVEVAYQREIPALSFGGRTVATFEATALRRPSSDDIVGRDVNRIGAAIDWRRSEVFGPGFVASTELGFRVDAYSIAQDSTYERYLTRTVPRAAAELRWPLSRTTPDGGHEIIEPVIRLDVADADGDDVPLEDSRVVEFDEANLFSASRYAGSDGVEDGARVAAGVTWHRDDPDGWRTDIVVGRLAHLEGDLGFSEGTGLSGDRSEWLLAAHFGVGDHFWVMNRSLFSERLDFTLSETRLTWEEERYGLSSSYIFAEPEPAEDRTDVLSEWSIAGRYDLTENWSAEADVRYDFTSGRAARTGLGLTYRNECVDLSLSLTRRYATSTSIDPTTDFNIRVGVLGIGGREGVRSSRRKCMG